MIKIDGLMIDFIIIFLIIFPVEFLPRLLRKEKVFDTQLGRDFSYYVINSAILIPIISPIAYFLGEFMKSKGLYLSFYNSFHQVPSWLKMILVLFLLDLSIYWYHRIVHKLDVCWKMHRIHHSSPRLIWFVATREHVFLIWFMAILVYLVGIFLGLNLIQIVLMVNILRFASLLQHTNFTYRFKFIEKILMTPYFHQFHHDKLKGRYVNFSILFPVLDIIFGTYYCPKETEDLEFGIEEDIGTGFWSQQLSFFKKN